MRRRQHSFVHILSSDITLRGALLATAAALIAGPAYAQPAQPAQNPQSEEAREEQTNPGTGTLETPASEQNEDQADQIVVTGIRQTIQTSIARKQEETAIVDALAAEEIGDLPALSVGEAIQTITGATTHREKGGATEIAIRGLGPFLSNSTFNGREATNGSGDRSVNFNQFPSELINGIAIYKTQQANLVEGGVAGTIEIETLRPLDYGRQRLQAELKGNYSPYQDNIVGEDGIGFRGTISYVDQFRLGAGEIGISLGFQRNDTNNPEQTLAGSSTWTACNASVIVTNNNCREVTRAEVAAGTPYFFVPNSFATRQIVENDRRDAFFGAIQWKPSDTVEINIDAQYSDRVFSEQRNDLNLSEMRRSLRNAVFTPEGVVTRIEGQSTIETNSTLQIRSEEYLGGGLDIAIDFTDDLKLVADLSYSRTHRVETDRTVRLRSDPRDINNVVTPINNQRIPYVFEVLPGNFAPTITIDPRFNVNNADLFSSAARLRRDQDDRTHEIIAGRLDAIWDTGEGFISQIDAGVRAARLTYNDFSDRVEINNTNRTQIRDANLACRRPFPEEDFLAAARGNAISSYATFDPICLFRQFLNTEDPGRNQDVRSIENRDVEERTLAAYVMATYASELGSIPVRGNFGARVVNTNVTSVGLRSGLNVVNNPDGTIRLVQTGNFEEVTIESETTRLLPSINAIFELQPDLLFRLAGYRAMSRPNPSALGAGRNIDLDDGTGSGSIQDAIDSITANGSPRLEPLMSWNADAALEWYPNRDTIVAGTFYYKNFSGGFIPVLVDEQFTIGGQNVTIPVAQTANSDDQSNLWGIELTLAHTFSWLPEPFDGLGAKISYNYAKSNFESEDIVYGDVLNPATGVVTEGFVEPANIFGLSEHVLSAQAFYEKGPFSIQAVFNFRSNYYQEFVGGNTQLRYVRDNETVDLRASLEITDNISLRAEAVNLFDEPKVTDMPVQGSIRQYHYYGPRYFLGVRVRL